MIVYNNVADGIVEAIPLFVHSFIITIVIGGLYYYWYKKLTSKFSFLSYSIIVLLISFITYKTVESLIWYCPTSFQDSTPGKKLYDYSVIKNNDTHYLKDNTTNIKYKIDKYHYEEYLTCNTLLEVGIFYNRSGFVTDVISFITPWRYTGYIYCKK